MDQQQRLAGGVGVVRVGELLVTVTPLTMTQERALRRVLTKAAAEAATDYFTRCAKLLAAMKSQPAAYLKAVETITALTATGPTVSDEQLYEFRESPAGVAVELFFRGRAATPGLDPAGLRAVITDENVDAVIEELRAAGEGAGPNAPTP